MYSLLNLSKKTALITGASSGIGRAIALMLGQQGVHLNLVARREANLIALKKEIEALKTGNQIKILVADINDSTFLQKLTENNFQQSDILINNAGLAKGKNFVGELTNQNIELVINTNLTAAIKLTNVVLPWMRQKKLGDIVNICSIASHEAYAGGAVYCASKFGLLAFAQSVRKETHGENIRVVNVSPGMVETEFSKVRFEDEQMAKAVYQDMKPLLPEDIAFQILQALQTPRHVNLDEIVILASDQGSATTVKRKS